MIEQLETGRALYLSAVLALWDKGMDTVQIAKTLRDDQAHIERALHEALDRRRRQEIDHGQARDLPEDA